MRNSRPSPALSLGLVFLLLGCRDAAPPATRGPGPVAVAPRPSPTPALPSVPPQPLESLQAAGRPPLELSASAVPGHQPLPTYRATVRNLSDRPVRRVVATAVFRDEKGRAIPGEKHDVAFGSPRKAIDPGATLETSFLSRVDHAPSVVLVVREVTFLEAGKGPEPVPMVWASPRYEADLAAAESVR